MAMVAEVIDAVVGGDTHKDTHTLEMLSAVGATITTLRITNDQSGYAAAMAWIAAHAPGRGTRSPVGHLQARQSAADRGRPRFVESN